MNAEDALAVLDALHARLSGGDFAAADAAVELAGRARVAPSRYSWGGDVLQRIELAVLALGAHDLGLHAPAAGAEPPSCTSGAAVSFAPFTDAALTRAHGIPGVSAAAATVSFTAPHPGTYRLVVTGRHASGGWAWRAWDVVCRPAR